MKLNNLLKMLLGVAFMRFGVVGDEGGGNTDDKGGQGGTEGGAGEGEGSGGAGEGGGKEGETKPTDAEAKLIKEVMDKKTRLKNAEEKVSKLESDLKRFEGIDPDAVRAILAERKDKETKDLEAKGQWDSLKKQMNEEHSKQLGELGEKLTATQSEAAKLREMIAELTVGNAFASSGFIKEDLTMPSSKVRVLYGSHFEFSEGSVVAYDKPAGAADRTVLVDAKGDPLNFDAALKKIVDADPDREQLLRSKAKPGAGSKTVGKEAPERKFEQPRGAARISAALAKGGIGSK